MPRTVDLIDLGAFFFGFVEAIGTQKFVSIMKDERKKLTNKLVIFLLFFTFLVHGSWSRIPLD
jgi:hypothetical protein